MLSKTPVIISLVPLIRLLKSPNTFIPPFHSALADSVRLRHDPDKHDIEGKDYTVGFRGSFGDHHLNPRTLRASHLGKMISVEGIVTRCMSVAILVFQPLIVKLFSQVP
jgi:DNA replicative helicase MCM subunit Mcm2 (Cdc46/Mcm family)